MKRIQKRIVEKIEEFGTIIIHRHQNPDPDALGSQGGLAKVIKATFPEKNVHVVGEEVEGLKFLNQMDTLDDSVYDDSLVIVCDTAITERISDERYNNGSFLIKIDHHPNRNPFGDLEWVDTTYSSTSEMIMDLIQTVNAEETMRVNFEITNEAARLLFAGIVGDTGRFQFDNTSPRTMYLAGELMECGFDATEIYNELYKIKKETANIQGYILQNFDVTEKGVASMFITKELQQRFNVNPVEVANLVNILSNIEGNQIWVFFVEYDEEIRVRIRSKKTTINQVAIEFDGGGHPLASGASVKDFDEAKELIKALDNLL